MIDRGATTLWEHWLGEGSHDHPMFGASAAHLFTGILGIGQTDGTYGYESIVIAPNIPNALEYAEGSITTVKGKIRVGFRRNGNRIEFSIEVPDGVHAEFKYREMNENITKNITQFAYEE